MTDAERRRRAGEAERLLNEPLLVEAFNEIEQTVIEAILTISGAEPEDDRARRMLADRVNAIRSLRTDLKMMIAQGKQIQRQAVA